MNAPNFTIAQTSHPILRPSPFVTRFPRRLGDMPLPDWVHPLLSLDAEAPISRQEEVRLRVRNMLRHWGHKPAGRGKPASEYLVRAVDRGDLGAINLAVDICNVVSLHSGYPIALIDLDKATPPFFISPGEEGETYVFNASGQEMSLKGLICLRDAQGPCANPVKDAQRTKTDDETTETLTIIWGAEGHEDRTAGATSWYRDLLARAGAETIDVELEPASVDPGEDG